MKRRSLSLICCMALLLLGAGGCKKKTVAAFDGMTPAEIIDKIYANVSVELPMLATTDITAENMAYYLGVSDLAIEAGAASEPLVNAIPFSLCVLRISQKADSAGMQQTIRNSVNPQKWICVGVEQENVVVDGAGDIIILIMAEESEALHQAFKDLAAK